MTPAIDTLRVAEVAHEILEYNHDPRSAAYGLEAAEALNQDPALVFKTLLVATESDKLAVAIVPVALSLNLKAMASAIGVKRVQMADPAKAERATGYVRGGISPLGQKRRHVTVIDDSAQTLARMYVSGGKRGVEIGVAPLDLATLLDATYAPLAR